jgi:hypothetical protein
MAFGNSSHSWVAGHLRNQINIQREERGFQAHAGAGDGRFAACVPGSNDDYVELFSELH